MTIARTTVCTYIRRMRIMISCLMTSDGYYKKFSEGWKRQGKDRSENSAARAGGA
jgi:hypothetical protein